MEEKVSERKILNEKNRKIHGKRKRKIGYKNALVIFREEQRKNELMERKI